MSLPVCCCCVNIWSWFMVISNRWPFFWLVLWGVFFGHLDVIFPLQKKNAQAGREILIHVGILLLSPAWYGSLFVWFTDSSNAAVSSPAHTLPCVVSVCRWCRHDDCFSPVDWKAEVVATSKPCGYIALVFIGPFIDTATLQHILLYFKITRHFQGFSSSIFNAQVQNVY